jgi:putative hydrolase of the HAD superfamily
MDTLQYLHEKYHLHLITNGFEEVQITKIKVSGIGQFFREVITSEKAGALKPDPRIFRYALDATGAVLTESIYIGDNLEADIIGARKAGWPQVYFNPDGLPHQEVITHEIRSLKELQTIF